MEHEDARAVLRALSQLPLDELLCTGIRRKSKAWGNEDENKEKD